MPQTVVFAHPIRGSQIYEIIRVLTKPQTAPLWHTGSGVIAAPSSPTISYSVRRECDNKTRILPVGVIPRRLRRSVNSGFSGYLAACGEVVHPKGLGTFFLALPSLLPCAREFRSLLLVTAMLTLVGLGLDDWGKLLGDSAAVTAMLDRLLHHGHVLKCGPRSWRTKTGSPGESQ